MQINKFVISLGGSAVVPDEIDINFLKKFCFLIKKQVYSENKFVLVVGGGATARKYQQSVEKIVKVSQKQKDWVGIHATWLNASFVKAIFGELANPSLLNSKGKIKNWGKFPIIVGAGWKPGNSTDLVAVQIAIDFKIGTVVNVGKPEYVYNVNPDKDSTAKSFDILSWNDYLKIIPDKWSPGMNVPFDPVASRLAQKNKIKVIVAGAKDLQNINNILSGKKFQGTTILD